MRFVDHSNGIQIGGGIAVGGGGVPFAGALDAFTADMAGAWSVARRLLASYTGPLIGVRRGSDDEEIEVAYNPDGTLDTATLLSFLGSESGFVHTVFDQSGNARHFEQNTGSFQPQIDIDGNGYAFCYPPGSGFTTCRLDAIFSLAITDSTVWSVAGSSAYATDLGTIRFASFNERRNLNYSSAIEVLMGESAGSSAFLSGTGSGVYSVTLQVHAAGHRLSNRLSSASGSKASTSQTVERVGFGLGAGGSTWSQGSPFYAMALWSADIGDAAADSVNDVAQLHFDAL